MKQVTTKIICDKCGKDISPHETNYPAVYILEVKCINIALPTGVSYGVCIAPIINKDLHFCGLVCMREY